MFKTGSDYMPFFADLGIPSMDFRFTFDAVSSNTLITNLRRIVLRHWGVANKPEYPRIESFEQRRIRST